MLYQLVQAEFYGDLNGRPILTGNFKVIKEFEADDRVDAQGVVGQLFDAGLPQEHPLPDVDSWRWEVVAKE